jgi:hypothetical protein
VTPTPFGTPRCVGLFTGYTAVTPDIADRFGDTFPLPHIRNWFTAFAAQVWSKIEASSV